MNPGRESCDFVGWSGEDQKNTPHHPRFCLDSDLDTDDFANMGLFIDEVSRTVTTTFKLKKYPGQRHWDWGGCKDGCRL
jgi:hypothetical protein